MLPSATTGSVISKAASVGVMVRSSQVAPFHIGPASTQTLKDSKPSPEVKEGTSSVGEALYPETETFVSSGIYARYAFDTYYTVDMDGVDISSVEYNDDLSTNERIEAYRSYNYRQEMLALGARIVLTILIEMLVALLFGFRQKKQLLILAVVNIITQIILNVLLNVINYNSGPLAFTFFYVLFELIVFALEAVLYCTILKRLSEKKKEDAYYILYSFVANLISFGAGLFLAAKLPSMF